MRQDVTTMPKTGRAGQWRDFGQRVYWQGQSASLQFVLAKRDFTVLAPPPSFGRAFAGVVFMNIVESIEKEQLRREANFRAGDTVKVGVKIKEGDKERVQVFEGVVIAMRHGGSRATFTVRKVSYGVGVERVFPLHSPAIDKIDIVTKGAVRRAKLYFLRELAGKAARLKERDSGNDTAEAVAAQPSA
jgi:large subunit ribosomal protein L19